MAVIANLDINLNARTKRFDKNVNKSGGVFSKFARGVSSFGGGVAVAGLAAVAAGAAAAGVAMVKVNEQFGKIDKLAKTADALGANVTELQALRHQAELTGSSIEGLDKGVERFNRVLGDARAGDATAVGELKELGLAAKDFDGLTLTQQMGKVSDAINEGETAADRASRAYAVFGKSGQKLQNFFSGGSEGIAKAADDIERFGAEITRVDAARIESMNDSWTRMGLITDSLWQNLAVESAPVIQGLVEMFSDAAAEFGGFGSIAETSMNILVTGIGFAMDGWNVFVGAWKTGQVVATNVVAGIVENLAMVESALVALGGDRFDFGLDSLADELNKETQKLANEAAKKFGDGFSGKLSNDLKDRIAAIKREAEKTAATVAERIEPPKIEPPDPGPLLEFGDRFVGGFLAGLNNIDVSSFVTPPEEEKEKASVTALARGSSAAQSFINRQKQESKTENAIKKAAEEQKEQLDDANASLSDIATAVTDGTATFVSLAGF